MSEHQANAISNSERAGSYRWLPFQFCSAKFDRLVGLVDGDGIMDGRFLQCAALSLDAARLFWRQGFKPPNLSAN